MEISSESSLTSIRGLHEALIAISSLQQNKYWDKCGLDLWLTFKFAVITSQSSPTNLEEFSSFLEILDSFEEKAQAVLQNIDEIKSHIQEHCSEDTSVSDEGIESESTTSNTEPSESSFSKTINEVRGEVNARSNFVNSNQKSADTNQKSTLSLPRKHISCLPSSVLSKIFELGNEDILENEFPFIISYVNKHFREVAMKTPDLWRYIWTDYTFNRTSLLLERSNSVGLTIHIKDIAQQNHRTIKLIIEHHQRWAVLIFDICSQDINRKYLESFIPHGLKLPGVVEIHSNSDAPYILPVIYEPFMSWLTPKVKYFAGHSLLPISASLTHCNLWLYGKDICVNDSVDILSLSEGLKGLVHCVSLELVFNRLAFKTLIKPDSFIFPDDSKSISYMTSDQAKFPPLRLLRLEFANHNQFLVVRYLLRKCFTVHTLPVLYLKASNDDMKTLLEQNQFSALQHLSLCYHRSISFRRNSTPIRLKLNPESVPTLKSLSLEGFSEPSPLSIPITGALVPTLEEITFRDCGSLNSLYLKRLAEQLTEFSQFKKLCFVGPSFDFSKDIRKALKNILKEKVAFILDT